MITICLTYFRSLTLANLAAALWSVRRQELSRVREVVVVDNDTDDSAEDIERVVASLDFPVPVRVLSLKHGDHSRTHAWSTNAALREVGTPLVLMTRADYLLDPNLLARFSDVFSGWRAEWHGFVTSNGVHLSESVEQCEAEGWRERGPRVLSGIQFDYTDIDAGVWMTTKWACDSVRGLDERLTAWGHAQTHFQWKLHKAGVEFVRVPQVMFWHPHHGGERDIDLAHRQLRDVGVDIGELWSRYHGASPYR